jgi:oligopeptide transport system substrate-binding protein
MKMRVRRSIGKSYRPSKAVRPGRLALFILFAALLSPACSEISTPKSEPLIVQTAPPAKQEFRWSNGKMPKSFDPALAAAAPETDIVRALFEGLTDIDPRTLREKPAVAEKWTASEDLKTWTFFLRSDAKWSNGEPVTAHDFVRSWTRLAKMGAGVPHRTLFYNIEGLRGLGISPATAETPDFLSGSGRRKKRRRRPRIPQPARCSRKRRRTRRLQLPRSLPSRCCRV